MKEQYFNLAKAMINRIRNDKPDEFAANILSQGEAEMKKTGLDFDRKRNSVVIPARATIEAGSSAISGKEIQFIMPAVSDKLTLIEAGAKYLPDLYQDCSIPTNSGNTVNWAGETEGPVSDGIGTISSVDLKPNRLILYAERSNALLAKASENNTLDNWLKNDIIAAIAAKVEKTILGKAARGATSPQGLLYSISSGIDFLKNAETPTLAKLTQLEADIDAYNALKGNSCSYIMSGKAARILRATPIETGHPERILANDNLINGYKTYFSNCVSDAAGADSLGSGVVFANWAALVIAQFGVYDIEVDHISLAKWAKTRIIVNAFFDAKGLFGEQVTDLSNGVTDPFEYAYMSSAMAIK